MSVTTARKWIILASLIITGAQILFYLIAPAIGFPLSYPKNIDLLQIVTPVFLGYLGAATHFIFQNTAPQIPVQNEFLGMLVIGPIVIYAVVTIGSLLAFAYMNRAGVPLGSGMSVDNLATALSLSLGVLAVTTGIISSYLFVAPNAPSIRKPET